MLLEVRRLTKKYALGKKIFSAVGQVSFSLAKGEVLGLVGGSGCGKSTLARLLMRLIASTEGQIFLDGEEITHSTSKALCRRMQMVFQDPFASLNPRMTVGDLIAEPTLIHGLPDRVDELLEQVALPKEVKRRYPHEFSGGQRQRIGIARALALRPDILICDEPISALDVSIQAQILQLLMKLKEELGLTYLFIAHDLAVVHRVSDRISVMSSGQIVETASSSQLFTNPQHTETKRLIKSIPQFKKSASPNPLVYI